MLWFWKAQDYKIIPTDKPTFERKEISLEEALKIAFEKRPELEQVKIDIKNKDLDFKYAKNPWLFLANMFVSENYKYKLLIIIVSAYRNTVRIRGGPAAVTPLFSLIRKETLFSVHMPLFE